MSYSPPAGDSANFSWVGAGEYAAPSGSEVNFSWVPESSGGTSSTITMSAVLGPPVVAALISYDNRNPRRASTAQASIHQVAGRALPHMNSAWGLTDRAASERGAEHGTGRAVVVEPGTPWVIPGKAEGVRDALWALGKTRSLVQRAVHEAGLRFRAESVTNWQIGTRRSAVASAAHQSAAPRRSEARGVFERAAHLQALVVMHYGKGRASPAELLAPWGIGRPVPPGLSVLLPGGEVITPRELDFDLVFCRDPYTGGPINLVFGWSCGGVDPQPGAPLYILPARYYMVVHDLRAHRLPDLTEIPIFNVSMGADRGSFGWSFEASVPEWAYDAFAPTSGLPAQIRITLDGIELVFCVTGRSFDNSFGTRSVRLSGVSLTTLLARPYSREKQYLNTSARTAQQLAIEALEFTGFSLDWGLTDWLVGAGAWSHTGSPLAAVQAIVEAAGGYLQSHRSAATILARHPYPELAMTGGGFMTGGPWNWGLSTVVPDVEIAPDALATIGVEWQGGNDLNAVYVSGVSQGVSALVKREYTAGEKLSTPVSDPLITAVEAARQRGLSILGAAGAKESTTYSLPLLTGVGQPGLLDVGQLVQVNVAAPWRGRVRSVRASATYGGAVRQAVQIERHLEST